MDLSRLIRSGVRYPPKALSPLTAKSLSQGEEAEVVRGVALDRLYLQSLALRLQREGSTPELANLLDVILRLDWEGAREPLDEALGVS